MKNKLFQIVLVSFIIRFVLLLINNFWFILPQGGADAIRFEELAYFMSTLGIDTSLSFFQIISNGVTLHLWIGSTIYSLFGRSPMIWGLFMVMLGSATVYNIHRGVYLITDNFKLANRSGWIACFFPNFAVLSALLLREVPIHFLVSLAILYLIKYFKYHSPRSLILFVLFGFIGCLFHPGVFGLFFGFIFFQLFLNKKSNLIIKLSVSALCLAGLIVINQTGIGLGKFGGSFEAGLESIQDGTGELAEHAGANYPTWLHLSGNVFDVLLMPVRLIAFYFAPLIPFMVRTFSHLIGIIDVIFYMYLLTTIYKRRKILWQSNIIKAIVMMGFVVSFIFAMGVSNFGTNVRHRAKLLPIILMIPIILKKDFKAKGTFFIR